MVVDTVECVTETFGGSDVRVVDVVECGEDTFGGSGVKVVWWMWLSMVMTHLVEVE